MTPSTGPSRPGASIGVGIVAHHQTTFGWRRYQVERGLEYLGVGFGGSYFVGESEPGDAVEESQGDKMGSEVDMEVADDGDVDAMVGWSGDDLDGFGVGGVCVEVSVGAFDGVAEFAITASGCSVRDSVAFSVRMPGQNVGEPVATSDIAMRRPVVRSDCREPFRPGAGR